MKSIKKFTGYAVIQQKNLASGKTSFTVYDTKAQALDAIKFYPKLHAGSKIVKVSFVA